MSHAFIHAERSAKRWGGQPEDYLAIHEFLDQTKHHLPDNRHRMVLHNGFGILLAERCFGPQFENSAGRRIFTKYVCEQHILEDLGFIPSLAECLDGLPLEPWIAGARKLGRSDAISRVSAASEMSPNGAAHR